ncbi:tRNA glutamyl-Q(34) synthetase GluQRS [Epidermidibacterium keratini]|uniref:Glutamyl-Q tRNA(Asp) synthetase n=1 Tax=Epidermidibacterium keratini TaxID=1891644 RepID=A0A7L4YSD2_9ACTN|nr:tRNA glutamyl-Q(34) synthetase GluQRS [Epidermidibacterium keratini]QHC02086.1 tRNA glutamyl-Q(34) synthetase GluQRS [Epidermidibacterium keratini]
MTTGRYAPSPTGELHLGNLRTAALAWLWARHDSGRFLVRVEDLDSERSHDEYAERQLADLAALGIDWDGEIIHQSGRNAAYRSALAELTDAGATFECFCTRREIREAQSAPHGPTDRYPGTCRDLSPAERERRRETGRPPTIRLRGGDVEFAWDDLVLGAQRGIADDVPLQRFDGAIAYNLAVVVDDLWQGVDQVIRGDDLVSATPSQIALIRALGGTSPTYGHVPLVLGPSGARLAKRDGAVTMADLAQIGVGADDVVRWIARSLGGAVDAQARTLPELLDSFTPARLPRSPITWNPDRHGSGLDNRAEP